VNDSLHTLQEYRSTLLLWRWTISSGCTSFKVLSSGSFSLYGRK